VVVSPEEWKRRVCLHGCAVHDDPADCDGVLQAHHVITQGHLRKHGLEGALWDVRNGLCCCEGAHRRHTLAVERIRRDRLPAETVGFAEEHGLGWKLDRYYT
jgi:hypothetical protein